MRQHSDRHRSEREFEEGDWVFVRFQSYKQLSLKQQGKNKLPAKVYDRYQINQKISHIAYSLDLPHTIKNKLMSLMSHVSRRN